MKSFFLFLIIFTLLTNIGCESSESSRKRGSASINPAAYSGDWMMFNTPSPERSRNDYEFYYKKCSLDHREAFPVGSVWECTPPD